MHQNQKKILDYLLDKSDGATLDKLSAHLEVTKTAAKEHLLKLDSKGYIKFIDVRGLVGRPKRKYLLSEEGHDVFPKQYSWLSNTILEHLHEDFGPNEVSKIMKSLGKKVHESMKERFTKHNNFPELFAELSLALNELGYRTSVKQSDLRKGAILEATNCVYHSVAKKNPSLCTFDTSFIESATHLDVKLEKCIARGESVCRFCLKKKQ